MTRTVQIECSARMVMPGVCSRYVPVIREDGRVIRGHSNEVSSESYATYDEAVAAAWASAKRIYTFSQQTA